ncbi:MAG TPA: hypothetical protein VE993_07835 [Stellaceae bacterium]|nr:hypothetical protein [Stellaceae bacterium]
MISDPAANPMAGAPISGTGGCRKLRIALGAVRGEIRESELRLRTEIERVRIESREIEVRLLRAMSTQARTILGGVAAIVGLAAALTHLFH